MKNEEHAIVIIQHIKTNEISDMTIGVLVIKIKCNKRSFAIDQSKTKNQKSKANLFLVFSQKESEKN